MGLFGWGKKEPIKDLTADSADEIRQPAAAKIRAATRRPTALIYHALVLNPYESEPLIRLSEFFDDADNQHTARKKKCWGASSWNMR